MQPYDILGLIGLIFTGSAAVLQYIGGNESRKTRGVLGFLFLCVGTFFAVLSYYRTVDAGFVAEAPMSILQCHAATLTAFWAFWTPNIRHAWLKKSSAFALYSRRSSRRFF